jgi:hypothetical protein
MYMKLTTLLNYRKCKNYKTKIKDWCTQNSITYKPIKNYRDISNIYNFIFKEGNKIDNPLLYYYAYNYYYSILNTNECFYYLKLAIGYNDFNALKLLTKLIITGDAVISKPELITYYDYYISNTKDYINPSNFAIELSNTKHFKYSILIYKVILNNTNDYRYSILLCECYIDLFTNTNKSKYLHLAKETLQYNYKNITYHSEKFNLLVNLINSLVK